MKKIIHLFVAAGLFLAGCSGAINAVPPSPIDAGVATTAPGAMETESVPPAAEAPGSPRTGGTLTRAITSEPASLDPNGPAASGQNVILPYLLDTLVYRDLDNSYKPYLAEEWTVGEDGKTLTFRLRPGVRFHDGTPLNAEAVRFSFERVMAEGSKSPLASGFANVEKIETIGEDQVIFTLKRPSSTFLSTLSTAYAGIVSPAAVEQSGGQFGLKPVGSGPFRLESWQPGERITLVRNEDYAWGPEILKNRGAPYLEKLVFQIVPDASSQLTAFQSGEVDVLFVNQSSQIAALSADPHARLVETTLNSLIFLGFNMRAKPFDDQRIRLAIAHAIDKDELVQLALGGVGETAFSPLAPTLPGFDPALTSLQPAYDLEQSAALLSEAGFSRQSDGSWSDPTSGEPLALEILTTTRPPNEALATVIQAQLQRAGIAVTIRPMESAAAGEIASSGDYEAMLWRYDWNDADVLSVYFSSARMGQTNRSFYSNPGLDEILASAATEQDSARRNELYSQAQKILIEEQPWIPLYTPKDYMVMRSTLQDAVFGPIGRLVLNDAWLLP